jgi:phosphatidylglycerol:prolipoprotein diacylglycerol transferase
LVHDIDPVIASIGAFHLWWYGFSYATGFATAHLSLRRARVALGLPLEEVYQLTLCLAVGVLAGGRSLVVFSNEWPFYREHPMLIPAIWLGGLATHGLILGGLAGVMVFCTLRGKPIRPLLDALAVPTALILGCGRLGNFIDGQIVGTVTTVPWGVKFPDVDGVRHPVVLYDGLKNFLIIPILHWVGRTPNTMSTPSTLRPGRIAVLFTLLYSALRIPIDLLRDYPIRTFGLPTGQTFNLMMVAVSLVLLLYGRLRAYPPDSGSSMSEARAIAVQDARGLLPYRLAFAALVVLALVIPSDATRDIPDRYGARHPGLAHTAIYPALALR